MLDFFKGLVVIAEQTVQSQQPDDAEVSQHLVKTSFAEITYHILYFQQIKLCQKYTLKPFFKKVINYNYSLNLIILTMAFCHSSYIFIQLRNKFIILFTITRIT